MRKGQRDLTNQPLVQFPSKSASGPYPRAWLFIAGITGLGTLAGVSEMDERLNKVDNSVRRTGALSIIGPQDVASAFKDLSTDLHGESTFAITLHNHVPHMVNKGVLRHISRALTHNPNRRGNPSAKLSAEEDDMRTEALILAQEMCKKKKRVRLLIAQDRNLIDAILSFLPDENAETFYDYAQDPEEAKYRERLALGILVDILDAAMANDAGKRTIESFLPRIERGLREGMARHCGSGSDIEASTSIIRDPSGGGFVIRRETHRFTLNSASAQSKDDSMYMYSLFAAKLSSEPSWSRRLAPALPSFAVHFSRKTTDAVKSDMNMDSDRAYRQLETSLRSCHFACNVAQHAHLGPELEGADDAERLRALVKMEHSSTAEWDEFKDAWRGIHSSLLFRHKIVRENFNAVYSCFDRIDMLGTGAAAGFVWGVIRTYFGLRGTSGFPVPQPAHAAASSIAHESVFAQSSGLHAQTNMTPSAMKRAVAFKYGRLAALGTIGFCALQLVSNYVDDRIWITQKKLTAVVLATQASCDIMAQLLLLRNMPFSLLPSLLTLSNHSEDFGGVENRDGVQTSSWSSPATITHRRPATIRKVTISKTCREHDVVIFGI